MIVDLFAGPGGWDIGARQLGLDPTGIELDADACATRAAAGLPTIRTDLTDYRPPDAPIDGLIASPPCPEFSDAGNRNGVGLLPTLCTIADAGHELDEAIVYGEAFLSLVPLWWTLRHQPTWVALEQVPPVLPLWHAIARRLARHGYSTWHGILNAADYGVPQTRRRAFMLAHRHRTPLPPEPTHATDPQPQMFGPALEPWVTMAEALGPIGEVNTGRDYETGPAQTITEKARSAEWTWRRPATTVMGDPRIWPPGHKINADDRRRLGDDEAAERYGDRAGTDAIRLTIDQAAVLQGFPPDYPWRGSTTSRFRQCGNAVPPPLAAKIIEALTQ